MVDFRPHKKELEALRLFVSKDTTREGLSKLWCYPSTEGRTYVATDGHTLVARRSGSHRDKSFRDVALLSLCAVGPDGVEYVTEVVPPRWDYLFVGDKRFGKVASSYGMNPDYFARIGDVERAAGRRASDDFVPRPGMRKKDAAKAKSDLRTASFSVLRIPSNPLDPWFWKLTTEQAVWDGILMPRRV